MVQSRSGIFLYGRRDFLFFDRRFRRRDHRRSRRVSRAVKAVEAVLWLKYWAGELPSGRVTRWWIVEMMGKRRSIPVTCVSEAGASQPRVCRDSNYGNGDLEHRACAVPVTGSRWVGGQPGVLALARPSWMAVVPGDKRWLG